MPKYYLQTTPGVLAVLIRHGSTKFNNGTGKIRGWADEPLSPGGRIEVQMLARKLKPYDIKFLYSSDFMRDTETKFILATRLGISGLESSFDARTWDTGLFSGQDEDEVNPAITEIYHQPWESAPGGSESFNDFVARWTNFLDSKLEYAANSDFIRPIGIICHGRNIATAQSYLMGMNAWDAEMPRPAGFAVISVEDDRSLSMRIMTESESVLVDK